MSRPDLLLPVQPLEGQEGEGWRGAPTLSCETAETSNLQPATDRQTKESGCHAVYETVLSSSEIVLLWVFKCCFRELNVSAHLQSPSVMHPPGEESRLPKYWHPAGLSTMT